LLYRDIIILLHELQLDPFTCSGSLYSASFISPCFILLYRDIIILLHELQLDPFTCSSSLYSASFSSPCLSRRVELKLDLL
jgi:hypothetical protein